MSTGWSISRYVLDVSSSVRICPERNGQKVYIVQQPHSVTNPSSQYRVTWNADLMRFMNGATNTYAFVAFSTYGEALAYRDDANKSDKS